MFFDVPTMRRKVSGAAPRTYSRQWSTAAPGTPIVQCVRSAVTLANGSVLALPGSTTLTYPPQANAYRYDPGANNWTRANTPSMTETPACTLANGSVLIAGWAGTSGAANLTTYIYNPSTNAYATPGNNLPAARGGGFLVALANGDALYGGGWAGSYGAISNACYYFNSGTSSWSTLGNGLPMSIGLCYMSSSACLLANGSVFVTPGAINNLSTNWGNPTYTWGNAHTWTNGVWAQANISGVVKAVGMTCARMTDANGSVLIGGGSNSASGDQATFWVYNPTNNTCGTTNSAPYVTDSGAMTTLSNGCIMLTGGTDFNNVRANTAIFY